MENKRLGYLKSGKICLIEYRYNKYFINDIQYLYNEFEYVGTGQRVKIDYGRFKNEYGVIEKITKSHDIIVKLDMGKSFVYPYSGLKIVDINNSDKIRFNRRLETLWI